MAEQSTNEIKSVVSGWIDGKLSNLHTCITGKIISYDSSKNRASVRPDGEFKTEDERSMPFPIIYSVPVIFPTSNGGKSGVTFPIRKGDGGLIVFSESQLTDFLSGEGKSDSADPRRHSLNDAIFIPGLYSNAVAAQVNYSDDVCVFNELGIVRLNSNELTGEVVGTEFSFSGGDLVVNGISLVHHVHGGVAKGTSTTGQPQ